MNQQSSSRTNGKQKQKNKKGNSTQQNPEAKRYYDTAIKHLIEAHRWNVLLQGEESPDSQNTRNYLEMHNIIDEV